MPPKRRSKKKKAKQRIELSSSREGLEELVRKFPRFARRHRLPLKVGKEIHLALDEIVTNIVHHGHGDDGDEHSIVVELLLADGVLQVEVIDDAPPFNMLSQQDPRTDLAIEERPIGGLGIYLVKQLMDEVRYTRQNGCNHLVLRRKLDR